MRTPSIVLLAGAALFPAALTGPAAPAPRAAGAVSGTVTFTGTPPKMKPIDMSKEPSCASQHATPVTTQNVVTGPGNSLQYVVVYVSAGDPGGAPATETVRYDQKGCQYLPHVAVLEANQPLEIYNDDQTSHNIHPLATTNAEWNKSQPPGAPPIHTSYAKPEFIPVKCNVHPWMHGYFAVLATARHAVSGSDGKFNLTGLPPGKYTLTAWHEKFGTQTQDVTITGSETATANFVFKATPY
ncbi:MAG TPA: carboxypeptidase regulatory-like domain-containing protein [Gemmatimonadales bacterium]|nr:carboxypeptidase regulatory-like domain-containing protein [Gemmatimonadales bacterium]